MAIGTPTIGTPFVQETSATTSRNVPYPATVNSGDMAFLLFANGSADEAAVDTPSGYVQINQVTNTANTLAPAVGAMRHTCTGTEGGTNLTVTSTSIAGCFVIVVVPGVANGASSMDVTAVIDDKTTASRTIGFPTITPVTANVMMLYVVAANSTSITVDPISGFTELADRTVSGARGFEIAYQANVSAGAHTYSTTTRWSGSTKDTGILMALRPAVTTTTVGTTISTTWNVDATVGATRATTWDTLTSVVASRATTWNVAAALTTVVKTVATTWRVMSSTAATRATTWKVKASVPATRATTWDVLTPTVATRSTTWKVKAAVAATRSTTWRVLKTITGARATTWKVKVVLATTRATTWRVLSAITGTRATTWDVLARISPSRSTTWRVLSSTATTHATTWRVLGRVVATRSTTWNVDATGNVEVTRSTTWRVLAPVTASRATTWNTKTTAPTTRSTTWNTLASTVAERAASWNVLVGVTTSRSTTWNVGTAVSTTRDTIWRTLQRVTKTIGTTWDVFLGTASVPSPVAHLVHNVHDAHLDANQRTGDAVDNVTQGDLAPAWSCILYNGPDTYDPTADTVQIKCWRNGSLLFTRTPDTMNADGTITMNWQAGDTDDPGPLKFKIVVTAPGNGPSTFPPKGFIITKVHPATP